MTTIPTIVESAIHEASHATLIILVLKREIESVEVNERGGGLTQAVPQDKPPPLPKPWEQRTIDSCAINFCGAIAAAKHCKYELRYDYDFEDHGAESDLQNFDFKARLICGNDRDRIAALRQLAMTRAKELVNEFWNAIVEVSLDLLDQRKLNHDEVLAAIARSGVGAKALGLAGVEIKQRRDGFWWVCRRDGSGFAARSFAEALRRL
jgi:hypothetical protein